jgi:hypothetical protein
MTGRRKAVRSRGRGVVTGSKGEIRRSLAHVGPDRSETIRVDNREGGTHMAPLKTCMTALCCGVVLCSVVTAQAYVSVNALSANALSLNGLSTNTVTFNALTYNGLPAGEGAPVGGPREGLPFAVITRKALGKTHP